MDWRVNYSTTKILSLGKVESKDNVTTQARRPREKTVGQKQRKKDLEGGYCEWEEEEEVAEVIDIQRIKDD